MQIAIVGATGLVGQEMIKELMRLEVQGTFRLFASARSAGSKLEIAGTKYEVELLDEKLDFASFQIALFSAGKEVALKYAPFFSEKGCYVIDNSSAFRQEKEIPLIVPEINIEAIEDKTTKIIANPNCSTIQSVIAFYKLLAHLEIEEIDYTTYQSVSGSGSAGIADLENNTTNNYPRPIKNNIIMQIDDFDESGNTLEELKMINESEKILNDRFKLSATCVRVPVFYGHGVSIKLKFTKEINLKEIKDILKDDESVEYIWQSEEYKTPIEIIDSSKVFVSRIRISRDHKSLLLFSVANNIKKGAATNAVQIVQKLIEKEKVCMK